MQTSYTATRLVMRVISNQTELRNFWVTVSNFPLIKNKPDRFGPFSVAVIFGICWWAKDCRMLASRKYSVVRKSDPGLAVHKATVGDSQQLYNTSNLLFSVSVIIWAPWFLQNNEFSSTDVMLSSNFKYKHPSSYAVQP